MRTGRAARKPRGGAGPALEWRLFGVEVLLLEDAASGDYNREPSVSSALHEAVARQLQIEPEQLPIENVRPLRDIFESKTVKEKTHFTRATVCVNS